MSYKKLKENKQVEELMLNNQFALEMLQTQLSILIREYKFVNKYNPVEHIKARLKSEESAIEKLEKKGYEVNITNLINHVHDMNRKNNSIWHYELSRSYNK